MASPFDSFALEQRWVEWRNTPRRQSNRTVLAKLPRGKDGKPAKADDPSTWLIRSEAEALFASAPAKHGGGVGLELGQCDPDIAIGGVDLDTCIVNGQLADWASTIIHRFKSYCEISPSGTGIKIFFYYQPCAELTELLGSQFGRSFKRPTGADHPPAIELFLAFRYFAVTEKPSHRAYREIKLVELSDLEWLITEFGPHFAGTAEPSPSTDNSRSAVAFRLTQSLRRHYPNIGFDRFCELLRDSPDPDVASWLADKGDDRQLRRLYQRAAPDDNPNWDDNITKRITEWQGRDFVRDAAGRWFDQWRNELVPTNDPDQPFTIIPTATPSWNANSHSLARWHGIAIPERQWFLDQWLPLGQVVGLYGTPGSRKSTLLLQWMIAACLGQPFAGHQLAPGPCYGLFCEDSETEIARRARAMLNAYGAEFADLGDCHAESLLGVTLTKFASFNRGRLVTSPAWDHFLRDLDRFKPSLVPLDVIPDFFGGNEISREEVHEFLQLLDSTAAERNFCCVFSAHPSIRGIATRSLASGSTGWEGKARARATISDPTDNPDDDNPTPNQSDRRTLTLAKANYAKAGLTIDLVFKGGLFIPYSPADTPAFEIAAALQKAERCFLACLRQTLAQGHFPSLNPRGNYAPRLFAKLAAAEGCSPRQLERAMNNLLTHSKVIQIPAKARHYPAHLTILDPQ